MSEELGKIEKPQVEDFKSGRKLFFVPLIVSSKELPKEYGDKCSHYWEQVESQISGLTLKLGNVNRIFHELVPESGEKGLEQLKELKLGSLEIVQSEISRGAVLEAVEDSDIMAELMDLSRCLSIGLQSKKVFSKIFELYNEVHTRRNDFIFKKLQDTLKENEIALLIMEEGHHVKFPEDMKVFYIAPPALDEIKRWLRDYDAKVRAGEYHPEEPHTEEASKQEPPSNAEAA
jgi:hypothetical protein